MSEKRSLRAMLGLVGAALVVCVALLLGGCVSTKGMEIQREFAAGSEAGTKAAADRQFARLRETQDQLYAAQVNALKGWVAELDANSATVAEGAENHDRYWEELRKAEALLADEIRKGAADRDVIHAHAEGFGVMVRMEENQAALARGTSQALLRVGLSSLGSIAAAGIDPKPATPGGGTESPAPALLKPTSGGSGQ